MLKCNFLVLTMCLMGMPSSGEKQQINSTDIEKKEIQLLGKSGLPIGTVFKGKLTIVEVPNKNPIARIVIPAIDRTISFDLDLVTCFALDPDDKDIRRYHNKEVVAFEDVVSWGYPLDFWEDRAPLIKPTRRLTGFYTRLIVRFPKIRPPALVDPRDRKTGPST